MIATWADLPHSSKLLRTVPRYTKQLQHLLANLCISFIGSRSLGIPPSVCTLLSSSVLSLSPFRVETPHLKGYQITDSDAIRMNPSAIDGTVLSNTYMAWQVLFSLKNHIIFRQLNIEKIFNSQ
jgi:hypothetical protein